MRDIWEKLRAAAWIPGRTRRTPPALSPSGLGAEGDGSSDGGDGEQDHLSALPDDVLLSILLRLPSAAAAARTSVLSRRWIRVWAQLPVLLFPLPAEPALPSPVSACAALARHAAPALRVLSLEANDADPRDATAVLRLAAPRLTGDLLFHNVVPEDRKDGEVAEAGVSAAVEMPCFDRAERLILRLGYLLLELPPSGVFAKLTVLDLAYIRFQVDCDIGHVFSSTHCPSLRGVSLFDIQGLSHLFVFSESLLSLCLNTVEELQQLAVVSPVLMELRIFKCFFEKQPVAEIIAPVLEIIEWADRYDPSSVHLGELAQLRILKTLCFADELYKLPEQPYNCGVVMLLQRFKKIPALFITIIYPPKVYCQYLMEALTCLPVENLHLRLVTSGHAVVSCVFHFLKISTSIRRLFLHIHEGIQEQSACSPDCVCHQPQDWKTEELFLNSLQELDICGLSGADYDFAFVKRLLGWAPVLKTVTIKFDPSASVDEVLCKELQLSRPETCMKFFLYRTGAKDEGDVQTVG